MKYEDPEISEAKKKEVLKWLKSICDPKFKLIEGLITMFIDKMEDTNLAMKIMKTLRKLNEHYPELVGKSFFKNKKFPDALVQYLEITELKDLAGDAFILLINVFSTDIKVST
jgi:hypothetical protein